MSRVLATRNAHLAVLPFLSSGSRIFISKGCASSSLCQPWAVAVLLSVGKFDCYEEHSCEGLFHPCTTLRLICVEAYERMTFLFKAK